jgi:putative aldouronate transport system permease protein
MKTKDSVRRWKLRQLLPIYVLALPALIWFSIFVYYPTVLGFTVSFQKYRLVGRSEWVGLDNYIQIFTTPGFWTVVKNTVIIGGIYLVLSITIPVIIALLLNEISRSLWKRIVQTSIYIPHLFGWAVIAGIWIYVLAMDRGFLNSILEAMGVRPIPFMAKMEYGKPLVLFLSMWKEVGYLCILYLASITTISSDLYEAAVIDGASRFRQALSITLPSIMPTIKVLAILNITQVFRLFDPIWVLRNPGNFHAIDTVMIHLKQYGIDRFQMGYASAISVLLFIVILVFTLATKQGVRYRF